MIPRDTEKRNGDQTRVDVCQIYSTARVATLTSHLKLVGTQTAIIGKPIWDVM